MKRIDVTGYINETRQIHKDIIIAHLYDISTAGTF
jgi:hypothetical protein